MKHEVLFQAAPAWLVGETAEERQRRFTTEARRTRSATTPSEDGTADVRGREMNPAVPGALGALAVNDVAVQYPGDYAGRVIAIRPVRDVIQGRLPSLKNMSSKVWPVVVLDLSDEEVQGLASRRLKVLTTKTPSSPRGTAGEAPAALGALVVEAVPVTFDDRWGAVASTLRKQFTDPEAAELKADDAFDFDGRRFAEVSGVARDLLAPTVTRTGTGLYAAKVTPTHNDDTQSGAPAGQVVTLVTGGLGTADVFAGGYVTNATRAETRAIVSHTDGTVTLEGDLSAWLDTDDLDIYDAWSTIQAAHDQLVTDQGATLFTSIQELRLYDGTFTENVVLSTSLSVNFENFLWVRAATGTTPIIDGGASHCWQNWPTKHTRFEGITFANTAGYGLRSGDAQRGRPLEVRGCTFNTANGIFQNHSQYGTFIITNCAFTITHEYAVYIIAGSLLMRGCEISGGISQVAHVTGQRLDVEGCTFRNAATGIITGDNGSAVSVKHCSFHGLTVADINSEWTAAGTKRSISDLVALNNIHEDSALVYWLPSRTRLANVDRNCIHNATKVARVNETDYTTLANWRAYADDTGASPDANSIDSDPLLTDPAGGDFGLAVASPCRNAGGGAGAAEGVNGVPFDPYHPDIGAWSSGEIAAPSRPSVAVTGVDGADVTATTSGDSAALHGAELLRASTGEVVDDGERSGPGEIALTAPELSARYAVVASCSNPAGRSLPSAPAGVFVSGGDGPFEELRSEIVSRLAAHSGVATLLGTDEYGAVPIYASAPATARRVPSVVYTLVAVPEDRLDRPGRWLARLELESWGGTPGVNDSLVAAADEVLQLEPFQGTAWAVKRIARTGDVTRWEPDGGVEVRRTTWSITVDRIGS